MKSAFEIDLTNACKHAQQADAIRLGIMKDILEGDEVVIKMAEKLLIAIENEEIANVKRYAQSLMDYLDCAYDGENFVIRNPLNVLVNI